MDAETEPRKRSLIPVSEESTIDPTRTVPTFSKSTMMG
jgi:hypothetical protein